MLQRLLSRSKVPSLGFCRGFATLQPFHLAFPVHSLELAREFYGSVLGLSEGRSSKSWIDYSLDGHQIVCHLTKASYRGQDHFNPVGMCIIGLEHELPRSTGALIVADGDEVPVPHFGLCLTVDRFHELAERLRQHNVKVS